MTKKKNIITTLLLLTYVLVLLHNIFPHHHHGNSGSQDCLIESVPDPCCSENNIPVVEFCNHENNTEDKSVICHFSDSFSKSNISSDFTPFLNVTVFKCFVVLTEQLFFVQNPHFVSIYLESPSLRAPPVSFSV